MAELKAINTLYNGYLFRSRLEARWAVFFDAAGIKYEYEPEGFELPSGARYLPDFYLPDMRAFVEVKGKEPSEYEKRRIDEFRDIIGEDYILLTLRGIPNEHELDLIWQGVVLGHYNTGDIGWDYPYLFTVCPTCRTMGLTFAGRVDYLPCQCRKTRRYNHNDPTLLVAYNRARASRFEHGETPTLETRDL